MSDYPFTNTSAERYLEGTGEVLKNLNKEISKIIERSRAGMRKAVLRVERDAKIKTPVSPQGGNLIGSYETDVYDEGNQIVGEIKNNAAYALYVHEMPETYHFNKPGSGPKFLEKALFENKDKILEDISGEAKIK